MLTLNLQQKDVERMLRKEGLIPDGYEIVYITRSTGAIPCMKIGFEKKETII